MDLIEITDFNTIEAIEDKRYQQLRYGDRVLPLITDETVIRQYRFGENYLLFFGSDFYEGGAFDIYVLNSKFKKIEFHMAPEGYSKRPTALQAERIRKISSDSLELDIGPSVKWIVRVFGSRSIKPIEAFQRAYNGWLPIYEYIYWIKPTYLSIRRAN